MEPATAAVLAAVLVTADTQAALADRGRFPVSEHPYLYYISTATFEPSEQPALNAAIRLMVASTSLQPVLDRCTPVPVTDSLSRIDLRELKWDWRQWHKVLATYPYAGNKLPLVVRADWLLVQLADAQKSDAYYRLLFGADIPKTRDEWLTRLGVGNQRNLTFGLVEGSSGVSKQDIRWIESRPVGRGYAWGTRDVLQVDAASDPLQHLAGDFRHDGEEWIVGLPKVSLTNGERGTLQVYLLANGQGKVVNRAPVDLVEDTTQFRGLREIRTAGSCIQCHSHGINDPSINELRRLIQVGADVYAYPQEQAEQIEQFHLGQINTEIRRNQEDYATAVEIVTGMEPRLATAAFRFAVQRYDARVDLERAALELYTTPEDLRLALGLASSTQKLPARVAGLAHGVAMPRTFFEEQYLLMQGAVQTWRARN